MKVVPIACGRCYECRQAKRREWLARLNEEFETTKFVKVITLTFKTERYDEEEDPNVFAAKKIELWRKRIVKRYKKAWRYWLITEKGHLGTERTHLHGFIFEDVTDAEIEESWIEGFVYAETKSSENAVDYCLKYITKNDDKHPDFYPRIFCSKGIGRNYVKKWDAVKNKFAGEETDENYVTPHGQKVPLPIYYRNKIYTEKQREELWIKKLNEHTRYVLGQKIDISTKAGIKEYYNALDWAQRESEKSGFQSPNDWKKTKYEKQREKFLQEE